MKKDKRKEFLGWIIVAGCFLLYAASPGLIINMASIFFKSVCEDLKVDRVDVSFAYTLLSLSQLITAPIIGHLMATQKKIWVLMIMGVSVVAASIFGLSLTSSMSMFYFFSVVIGLFHGLASSTAISYFISNWFGDHWSFAYGVALTGSGFASLMLSPVLGKIIENYSWRAGYRASAIIYMIMTVPVIVGILRKYSSKNDNQNKKIDSDGKAFANNKLIRSEVFKTTTFWFLFVASFCTSMSCMGTQQHFVPYLTDIGYSASDATLFFSLMMGIMIFGKILLGVLFEKKGICYTLIFGFCLIISAIFALLHAEKTFVVWIFIVFFGLGNAMQTVPLAILVRTYFGRKNFTAVQGVAIIGQNLGMALGTTVSGVAFDLIGSYLFIWKLYIVLCALALLFHMGTYLCYKRDKWLLNSP